MDEHFQDGEEDGFIDDQAAAEPPTPKKAGVGVKDVVVLGAGALALSLAGLVIYKRFAGGEPAAEFQPAAVALPASAPAEVPVVTNGAEQPMVAASVASAAAMPVLDAGPKPPLEAPALQQPQAPAETPAVTAAAQRTALPQAPERPASASVQPAPVEAKPAAAPQTQQADSKQLAARVSELERQLREQQDINARLTAELRHERERGAQARESASVSKPKVAAAKSKPEPKPEAKAKAKQDKAEVATKRAATPGQAGEAAPSSRSPRADFRIYAMRDGQAWVQDVRSRETIPVVPGAMLPDGSRVNKLDETAGVITTSSGEIRYSPAGAR